MKNFQALCILATTGFATSAHAFTFECRWVEQTGPTPNQFTVIGGNGSTYGAFLNSTHRFRLQLAVIDDATGAAPAGGLVGWNVGTFNISGDTNNTNDTRTPGRLNPFTFATQPGANGNPPLPGGDPFTNLTDIDATLGTQSPTWVCNPDGTIPPQPNALVRGRNSFVSVFEITSAIFATSQNYTITAGGNLIAATEWRTVGTPVPPDCGDPNNPTPITPGELTYAPVTTAPFPFMCVLNIEVNSPTPGAATTLVLGALLSVRRRREHHHP